MKKDILVEHSDQIIILHEKIVLYMMKLLLV
jgi:hypothetical protein